MPISQGRETVAAGTVTVMEMEVFKESRKLNSESQKAIFPPSSTDISGH